MNMALWPRDRYTGPGGGYTQVLGEDYIRDLVADAIRGQKEECTMAQEEAYI